MTSPSIKNLDEMINLLELTEFFDKYTIRGKSQYVIDCLIKNRIKTFEDVKSLKEKISMKYGDVKKTNGVRNIFPDEIGIGSNTVKILYSYFDSKGFQLFKGGYQEKELYLPYLKKKK